MVDFVSTDPYAPIPSGSLADHKRQRLAVRTQEKQEKAAPAPVVDVESLAFGDYGSGDTLARQAASSVRQGGGRIFDLGGSAVNKLFGTDIDVAPETGMSNQELADAAAGFTGRERYEQDVAGLRQGIAEAEGISDVPGLLSQAAVLGPRVLADSANTFIELAAGTALTGGAGLAAKGIQGAYKLFSAADKATDVAKASKKAASTLGKAPAWLAKQTSKTSLMTADLTEGMRQDYIKEHGEEPSAAWYAVNVPVTMALNAVELGIITKLAPKMGKEVIKDMKEAVKVMSSENRKNVARRAFRGVKKVFEGAGAEAGQEYLQSWHEILATKIEGGDLSEITTEALREFGMDENQIDATLGLLLGGAAGGTARAVTAAPTAAVAATGDVVKGVVKTGAKIAQSAADKASLSILSQEERDTLREQYETRKEAVDQKISEMTTTADAVDKATTVDELQAINPEVILKAQGDVGMTDEEMAQPKNLQRIKDKVASAYRADAAVIKGELEASNVARIAKKAAINVVDKSVAKAKELIKDIPVEELVAIAKDLGEKSITAVKELKSSTARGIVDLGLREGANQTKAVVAAAKSLDLDDLNRVAAVIGVKHPGLGDKLRNLAKTKRAELEKIGQRSKKVTTAENLSPAIVQMAKEPLIGKADMAGAAIVLTNVLAGNIHSKDALGTIEEALGAYTRSPGAKPGTVRVLNNRLDAAKKRLDRPTTGDVIETVKKAATDVADKIDKAIDAKDKDQDPETVTETATEADKGSTAAPSGELEHLLQLASTAIRAGKTALITPKMGKLQELLKAEALNTQEALESLVERIPGLLDDSVFFAEFRQLFDTNNVTSQATDHLATKAMSSEDVKDLHKDYHENNPECS